MMAALLPSNEVKSNTTYHSKKVDIHITQGVFFATSQAGDGAISRIEIRDVSTNTLLLMENACGGYSCFLDLSDLSSGTYTAKVICANTTHSEGISI